ncbi:MAG: hypothetical protein WBO55_16600 [Rhizobiaceae bacterium]
MKQLGMFDVVLPKSQAMGGGEPITSVAVGKTELAVAPLTTVLSAPGVELAAVFPEGLGANIDISIFLSTKAQPSAAAVLTLLTASELDGELAAVGVLRFKPN